MADSPGARAGAPAPARPRRRRRLRRGRLPLVEQVLAMLAAALPAFEFDAAAWGLPAGGRVATGPKPPPADAALAGWYRDLGLRPGADLAAVRAAWRRQVREHHPDLHGGDPERQRRGSDRVKDLNRAYREIRRRAAGQRG